MTRTRRSYSEDDKAAAVGLAITVGPVRAGRQLGIPHRNISNWMRDPIFTRAVEVSHERILETLLEASAAAAADLLRIIRDPSASDRDKVRASEVALDRYQLMSGGATERTENLNIEATLDPAKLTTDDVRAEMIRWMETIENASDEELIEHEGRALQLLNVTGNVLTSGTEEAA